MGFDLIKFLSDIVLSLFKENGVSNISIIALLIFLTVTNIKKIIDKRKELKKKKISIIRMAEHEARISVVLESILNRLYDRNVTRACVMQISNGGVFMNKVSLLKLHMTYEERVNTRVKSVKGRYNQVMINGKYDKVFAKICTVGDCFFDIDNDDVLQKDFIDDPDNIIYMHMLYGDNGYPIGIAMVGFSELDKAFETEIQYSLHNHIMEIEKILKS